MKKKFYNYLLALFPRAKTQKKKPQPRFEKIESCKSHVIAQSPGSIGISGLFQETMCYIGQYLIFSDAEEVINNLTDAGLNTK